MKKQIFNENGLFLRVDDAEPICEQDFCDTCGDCLSCYGDDPCVLSEGGKHLWVGYESKGE